MRSASGTLVTIRGVEYVSVLDFARRFDLKEAWLRPGKRVALYRQGVRLEFEADGREAEVNGLRVFLGEAARLYRRSVYISRIDADRFLAPMIEAALNTGAQPTVRTIALDAGHGGKDNGKTNDRLKVNEKTFTLDVVLRLEKLLEAAGYRVVLTRSDDRFVELDDRPAIAHRAGADIFVSVHFNSVENGAQRVTGLEVFSLAPQYQYSTDDSAREATEQTRVFNPGNAYDSANTKLAYEVHRQMLSDLKTIDRGHKRQRFKVLRLAQCPAILIEGGYLSNDAEARKIANPAYRQGIAESIARGIRNYTANGAGPRR
jgi:N-acetylmuramoyl-L-alanine amidase